MSSHFSAIFHLILFILAGNEDMHGAGEKGHGAREKGHRAVPC